MEGVRAGAGGRGTGEDLRSSQKLISRMGDIRKMWKWKAHHPSLVYKEAEWPRGHGGTSCNQTAISHTKHHILRTLLSTPHMLTHLILPTTT